MLIIPGLQGSGLGPRSIKLLIWKSILLLRIRFGGIEIVDRIGRDNWAPSVVAMPALLWSYWQEWLEVTGSTSQYHKISSWVLKSACSSALSALGSERRWRTPGGLPVKGTICRPRPRLVGAGCIGELPHATSGATVSTSADAIDRPQDLEFVLDWTVHAGSLAQSVNPPKAGRC
jgi:hypothetical protein